MKLDIEFRTDPITVDQFIDVLERSGLAERRPVADRTRIQGMLDGADLILTVWDKPSGVLAGVARLITDWSYCAYLSDLAVDREFQGRGLGKALMDEARRRVGEQCSFLLLAAPRAAEFYDKIGMPRSDAAFLFRGMS